MKASKILELASEIIQDEDAETWTWKQGVRWLNDAQRTIVNLDPSANAVTENFTLVSGTRQTLESDQIRLIQLTRNMGTDGTTPGTTINGPADWEVISNFVTNWHELDEEEEITDYAYDEKADPKTFWNYPPSDGTGKAEGIFQKVPTDITHSEDDINLADEYAPAMVDYLLWRWFSRDSVETPNNGRADKHKQVFLERIVGKDAAAQAVIE